MSKGINMGKIIAILFSVFALVKAQPIRLNGIGTTNLFPLPRGSDGSISGEVCSLKYRSIDGRCNNLINKEWGSARQPMLPLEPNADSKESTGEDLKSARLISNILCKQDGDIFSDRKLSEMVTFFGQFIDHNVVATTLSETEFDIEIPENDPIFANKSGILKFERNKRAPVGNTGRELPMNSLTSYLDLDPVYAADSDRANALRSFEDGKMAVSKGNMLPFNTRDFFNAPSGSPEFFFTGDHRSSETPVLACIHTIWVREHNLIADELKSEFPKWSDERLYQTARHINIAQFQKIAFEEFYPALTGRKLRKYKGYNPLVRSDMTDVYLTAGFRVGHTLVGNGVTRRGEGMSPLPTLPMGEMFFNIEPIIKDDVEPFIRGALYGRAQEIDLKVHDALRDFLFENVPEDPGFDLVALNLQRSRDHALPSYQRIRELLGLSKVNSFADITKTGSVQSDLATAYGTVDKVEAWIGMMAEDHESGSSFGPTLLKLWELEFLKARDGDRFYFRRAGVIEKKLRKLPRVKALDTDDQLWRSIILRTTKIPKSEFGKSVWTSIA